MGGSARHGVAFVHDRFRSLGSPHPTRLRRPTFPQGKALSTRYNFAEQYHPKKPSPGVKLSGGQFDSVKSSLNKGGCEADG